MKKMMALVLACVLLAAMLVGCGHKHDFKLSANSDKHFERCDVCGKTKNSQKHKLDENGICKVCGAEMLDVSEGAGAIYRYDDRGSLTEIVDYDEDGTVLYSQRWEYTYDGNYIKSCKEFMDGVLMNESFYLPKSQQEEGEDAVYCSEIIYFNEDGSKEHYKYNEQGENTEFTPYDENGDPYYTETYTYAYSADGRVTKRFVSTDGKLSREYHYAVGEFDMDYEKKVIYYDENKTVIREEEYDFYGNLLSAVGELPWDSEDEELFDDELPVEELD